MPISPIRFQYGRFTLDTMKGVKKENLPTKICPVCQRPFTWRKKWARHWDEVKYCSQRCRKRRDTAQDGS